MCQDEPQKIGVADWIAYEKQNNNQINKKKNKKNILTVKTWINLIE